MGLLTDSTALCLLMEAQALAKLTRKIVSIK